MDNVQIGSILVAQEKAASAVRFKRSTKIFSDMVDSGNVQFIKLPGCLPIEGGVPIIWKEQVIGAIGISGVTSAQDGQIAAAGAAALYQNRT